MDKELDAGVIEPCQSKRVSHVLFAPKKDEKLRFCINYRHLNSMVLKDSYAIPSMDEYIDLLGNAKLFSTLDSYSGYWQVSVKEENPNKTAFVCHARTFCFDECNWV